MDLQHSHSLFSLLKPNNKLTFWGWPAFLFLNIFLCALAITTRFLFFYSTPWSLWLSIITLVTAGFNAYALWFTRTLNAQKREQRLYQKVVRTLATLIAVPLLLLATFSLTSIYLGLNTWFDQHVQKAIKESGNIAHAYLEEHKKVVRNNMELFGRDLQDIPLSTLLSPNFLQSFLTIQAGLRSFNRAAFIDATGTVLGRSLFAAELEKEFSTWSAPIKGITIFLAKDKNHILGLSKPLENQNFFLLVSHRVDPQILRRIEQTSRAAQTYKKLLANRGPLTLKFIGLFLIATLLILILTVKQAIRFSLKMTAPLLRLTHNAQKIQDDQFLHTLPDDPPLGNIKEFNLLSKAFHRMAINIRQNQEKLKQAYKSLAQRHSFTNHVLANISSGVLTCDHHGIVILSNAKAKAILGYVKKKITKTPLKTISPELYACFQQKDFNHEKHVTLNVNGSEVILKVKLSKASETSTIFTFENISSFFLIQKQAAWADVARRVAHEIKNPLTPIQLSAERLKRLLKKNTPPPEAFHKSIDTIERQISHLTTMLNSFLSFAKMPDPQLQTLSLNNLIETFLALQKQAYPGIHFNISSTHSLVVHVDEKQIQQVLSNLTKNAIESIQTRQESEKFEGAIHFILKKEESHAVCILKDNGMGLTLKLDQKAANPYLTTKESGSGLGLAIVQKILSDHRGKFSLTNLVKERGARAILTLPLEK